MTPEEVHEQMLVCKEEIHEKLTLGEATMDELREELQTLTRTLKQFLELWEAGEGFFKVVRIIGVGVKWLAVTGGAVALIWGAFMFLVHGGHK